MLLKKSVLPDRPHSDRWKCVFCAPLREIRARNPLLKLKISISGAYFSAVETMADFFNTIGRSLSVVNGCYWLTLVRAAIDPLSPQPNSA